MKQNFLFEEMLRLLGNEKGAATARASSLYTSFVTNLYPAHGNVRNSRVHRFKIGFTVVSASNIGDTYQLLVIPANWTHVQTVLVGNGFAASAGVGCTVSVGDSGSATRYCLASDFDVTSQATTLAHAGVYYTPTSDTIMLATIGTAAAVVGKIAVGFTDLIAPG